MSVLNKICPGCLEGKGDYPLCRLCQTRETVHDLRSQLAQVTKERDEWENACRFHENTLSMMRGAQVQAERDELKARLTLMEASNAAEAIANTKTVYSGTAVMQMNAALEEQLAQVQAERDKLMAQVHSRKNPGCDATCPNYCIHDDGELKAELESDLKDSQAQAARYREALEWYADEDKRWYRKEIIAHGGELASRYDDEKGESVPVDIKPGQSLGYRWMPGPSLQADHGKRARAALAPEPKEHASNMAVACNEQAEPKPSEPVQYGEKDILSPDEFKDENVSVLRNEAEWKALVAVAEAARRVDSCYNEFDDPQYCVEVFQALHDALARLDETRKK
jgi:hypothetical protein